ncbi:SHC-transforming protein 1 [Schistocerca cancellata]|uniref:SHC-transforming protein 1 n=1 Tax=Schistocerca cancellata TaxID=274614 RepID=UPI002118C0A8|nr:SHC-transforming protein 1 [Schistocerca cancellata]XP_049788492.1 SHC-transforming protein 1 [Schistocerca cancellata]
MPRALPDGPGGSSFANKPARGWPHSDQQLSKEGITYAVRYIGCLEIRTSMKSLDFETRSQVAKECINRVCEAAGLKTVDKKRKVEKRVQRAIAEHPVMDYAGSNVNLTVSSSRLVLTLLETGRIIAAHDMPRISFASGGDTDTLDFVAYVAKDANDWRACYVLECGGGLAQDVIITVGQAFQMRYKEFLTLPTTALSASLISGGVVGADREYYNDLPGKVPPELGPPPPVPPMPAGMQRETRTVTAVGSGTNNVFPSTTDRSTSRDGVTSNLIDLSTEAPPPPPMPMPRREHEYVNDIITRDVFDMQPFATEVEGIGQRAQLQREAWFHGPVSRQRAEALLTHDGDFLVRESQGSPGQYVLTGMQGGVKKHLLLVDPEGVVRTKDRMFESVSHLINYHCHNKLPIISAESALVLRRPVCK